MPKSCRRVFDDIKLGMGSNASLLMSYYLKETKGTNDRSESAIKARKNLFEAMIKSCERSKKIYTPAFLRRQKNLEDALAMKYETQGLIIVGLGSSNILETGLTLNPLYGVPMIPGSSLKGIAAYYCSEYLDDEDYRGYKFDDKGKITQRAGKIYEALFGRVEDVNVEPKIDNEMGILRFYDAWILPESVLSSFFMDVMTPHHMKYYDGTNDLPSDFDSPNPVSFISVQGKFEVRIGCEDKNLNFQQKSEWMKFAHEILREALKNSGIGGKLTSGYGRMKLIREEHVKNVNADEVICVSLNKKGNPQFKYKGKKALFTHIITKDAGYTTQDSINCVEIVAEDEQSYTLKLTGEVMCAALDEEGNPTFMFMDKNAIFDPVITKKAGYQIGDVITNFEVISETGNGFTLKML